jgi:hypothetical protein
MIATVLNSKKYGKKLYFVLQNMQYMLCVTKHDNSGNLFERKGF